MVFGLPFVKKYHSSITKILVVQVNSNPKKNFDFHWILDEVRKSKLADINLQMKQLLNQHWDNICNNFYYTVLGYFHFETDTTFCVLFLRIHDISVDSVKFWTDGVILRSSDLPHSSTVPCFLINVIDQVILLFSSLFELFV